MTKSTGVGRGGVPPEKHRFPKGVSGNKLGRPRKKRDNEFHDFVREELEKIVEVVFEGRKQKMMMLQAISKKFVADLVNGSPAERRRTFEILLRIGVLNQVAKPTLPNTEALKQFVAELAEEASNEDPNYRPDPKPCQP